MTAVTVGLLFLLSLFFAPLFGSVPQEATAPVLILVGAMMMGESKNIDWDSMASGIPAFLTIVMMPLTYSITNGIVFGLVSSFCFYFTTGEFIEDARALFRGRRGETEIFDEETASLVGGQGTGSSAGRTPDQRRGGSRGESFADNEILARRPSFFNATDSSKVEAYERWSKEVGNEKRKTTPRNSPQM